jgi:hypothetical protein
MFPTQNLRYQIGTSSGDRKSEILRYQFGTQSVTTADVAIGDLCFHRAWRQMLCLDAGIAENAKFALCNEEQNAKHSNSHDS